MLLISYSIVLFTVAQARLMCRQTWISCLMSWRRNKMIVRKLISLEREYIWWGQWSPNLRWPINKFHWWCWVEGWGLKCLPLYQYFVWFLCWIIRYYLSGYAFPRIGRGEVFLYAVVITQERNMLCSCSHSYSTKDSRSTGQKAVYEQNLRDPSRLYLRGALWPSEWEIHLKKPIRIPLPSIFSDLPFSFLKVICCYCFHC